MTNLCNFMIFIVSLLLLATVSLAVTCAPNDANCELEQKKMKLMDKMNIKAIETKNQTESESNQPLVTEPFKIPKPKNDQVDGQLEVQFNPGLKLPVSTEQNSQKQGSVSQPQKSEPRVIVAQPLSSQIQTDIYR